MGRFALVIFDLDGTLVDSAADVVASELYALQGLGLVPPAPDWARRRLGSPLEELLGEFLGRPPAPAERERFVALYRQHHYGSGYPGTHPYPGAAEMLAALQPTHLLAVATTRPSAAASSLLDHVQLRRWFARVQGTEPHQPHKPDPTILRLVMAELGIAPARTLMVGDTARDIAAGRAAGVTTLLVCHDEPVAAATAAAPASDMAGPQPDHRVGSLPALLPIVLGS